MTQPEALYLAEILEMGHAPVWSERCAIAAELRRLHEVETLYRAAMRGRHAMSEELLAVERQRDALLEALQALYDEQEGPPLIRRHRQWQEAIDKARAAIAAVEGEKA